MVDKSNIDFKYSIEKIQEPINDKIILQETILDSKNMNNTFKTFEENLNKLYENTRFLEDAIDYCEAFLNIKIKDCSLDIKNTLKAIEDIRDINKNQGYIEHLVPFIEDPSHKKDRDGTFLPQAYNNNGYIMLNIKKDINVKANDIDKKSVSIAYDDNLKDLLQDKAYNTFYVEESILDKGITETIIITLEQPTRLNYVYIDTINCNLNNFRIVYPNGLEDYVAYNNGHFDEAIVSQIKFDINSTRHKTSKYWTYKEKDLEDVWNKVKEFEYKYALDANTKLEMEEILARTYTDEYNKKQSDIYNNNIDTQKETVEKTMYSYMFGIDSIKIKHIEQENESCFVSQSINIGKTSKNEYIQLHVKDVTSDTTSIEYYLLDGDIEIPILPAETKMIKNEKIFSTLPLRFTMPHYAEVIIKKDGMLTDISLEDAKDQILSKFSADYIPDLKFNYTPINSNVRVKAIIRKYSKQNDSSYIDLIKVRKYGGEVLWTDI